MSDELPRLLDDAGETWHGDEAPVTMQSLYERLVLTGDVDRISVLYDRGTIKASVLVTKEKERWLFWFEQPGDPDTDALALSIARGLQASDDYWRMTA